MKTTQTVISVLIVFLLFSCTSQQQSVVKMQSDNGDGTYTNPVIAADFP
jgi:hypothetical protein